MQSRDAGKPPPPTVRITRETFWNAAEAWIAKNGCNAIKLGTEEWRVWEQYFARHLRWTPSCMLTLEEVTMPTKFPQTFDMSFNYEDRSWRSPARKQGSPREQHETLAQLKARYGPNWGLRTV